MIKGLPEKLKLLRTKCNLSQKEAASRLGISPSIVSSYETGERTPSAENLLALSRLYRCSTDYLLGNNIQSARIALDANGLTDAQIRALQALIETMKS
ncbi:MAG: helix-turn-helix domain-containing protein [Lachnospiraceae bacterium]|nr:helix-turn-helix domain-containing protein [Lachnospiraceae bacterium]MDE7184573.1 helix-turn-helix domain-containing protein [Lachnospiraceae bacterium]